MFGRKPKEKETALAPKEPQSLKTLDRLQNMLLGVPKPLEFFDLKTSSDPCNPYSVYVSRDFRETKTEIRPQIITGIGISSAGILMTSMIEDIQNSTTLQDLLQKELSLIHREQKSSDEVSGYMQLCICPKNNRLRLVRTKDPEISSDVLQWAASEGSTVLGVFELKKFFKRNEKGVFSPNEIRTQLSKAAGYVLVSKENMDLLQAFSKIITTNKAALARIADGNLDLHIRVQTVCDILDDIRVDVSKIVLSSMF